MSYTFTETFIEIYNTAAAFVIVFLIGQILLMMRQIDKDVLKARLFLRGDILQKTWTFVSAAAAAFAVHSITAFMKTLELPTYYIYEISQVIFIIAFVIAVYQWYAFLSEVPKRQS
ncbi:MAG TPA: hypothetical protein HA257_09030 [Candidatus Methanoperedenaceae archaeon]|nr:hypothetical protein [Candidatus Methanoperedenaceae archaeon]